MAEDKFREAALRKQRQLAGEDDEGESKFMKWALGKNYRRFLPNVGAQPGEGEFYIEVRQHYPQGAPEPFACLTKKFYGKKSNIPGDETKCPFCRRFNKERAKNNRKYERDSEEGKKAYGVLAGLWGPKSTHISHVFDPKAAEIVVMPVAFGTKLMQALLNQYLDSDIYFWKIKTGRTMFIKKTALSKNPRDVDYTVDRAEKQTDISEIWAEIKLELPPLEEHAPVRLTIEEMEERVANIDAMAEEDEDEDKSRRPAPKRAKDEDDEEEKPTKPKCFANPKVHDPDDETCADCRWETKCAAKIEAAKEEDEDEAPPKPKRKLDVVKEELAGKSRRQTSSRVADDDDE